MLPGCLRSLGFADELYVGVDSRTTDATEELARASGAEVFRVDFSDFGGAKARGLEEAKEAGWILLVDADERVSSELAIEIGRRLEDVSDDVVAFSLPVRNYFQGRIMNFGGWADERPVRLIRNGAAEFVGAVHETVRFSRPGRVEPLIGPLLHFSHRSVEQSLEKDWLYVDLGAHRLLVDGAPPVTSRRMLARAVMVLLRRFVAKRAWKDGPAGIFDTCRVVSGEVATMMRLRELQQGYDPVAAYRELDERLQNAPDADR